MRWPFSRGRQEREDDKKRNERQKATLDSVLDKMNSVLDRADDVLEKAGKKLNGNH